MLINGSQDEQKLAKKDIAQDILANFGAVKIVNFITNHNEVDVGSEFN
jgi:hypothetical protein